MHHRRSIRLPGFDYSSEGGYFISLVTHERQYLFGEVVDGEMRLNDLGIIVRDEWFRTAELRPYIELLNEEFVVMPNHIHGIIWITDNLGHWKTDTYRWGTARRAPTEDTPVNVEQFGKPVSGSIPTIVRSYKSAVTKKVNELRGTPSLPVWQRNYYEHIIGDDNGYDAIIEYIHNNPKNWLTDDEYSS